MKSQVLATGLVCLLVGPVYAAPIAGRVMQDAVVSTDVVNRLTLGGGYESIDRQINLDGATDAHLRANALFGSLAFDISRNASVYVGLNQAQADRLGGASKLDDRDDIDWIAGLHINLWEHMVKAPSGEDGRLSISILAEQANYSSVGNGQEASWEITVVALPFAYHHYTSGDVRSSLHSTKFFAGPVLSAIDGDVTIAGSKSSFDESENNGVLFGVDVFMTEQFVFGGQAQYMNDYSFSFNARYHF